MKTSIQVDEPGLDMYMLDEDYTIIGFEPDGRARLENDTTGVKLLAVLKVNLNSKTLKVAILEKFEL